MEFNAAVLHDVDQPLRVERIALKALKPDDVLVRIRATSLCHTDLEVCSGQLKFPLPIVLGHEAAGVVEDVGREVRSVSRGDSVMLSWNPRCGTCFYCEREQPILCERYLRLGPEAVCFDGTTRFSLNGSDLHHLMYLGTFSEFAVVSEQCAVPMPEQMPFDRACLIACGVMTGAGAALNVAEVRLGDTAVVLGCGAVGLSALQGAKLAGAEQIVAVDLDDQKLALAEALGATCTINPDASPAVEAIRALTQGRGADCVFEAAGNETAFRMAVEACRPGGQVVWLGKTHVDQEVRFRWGSLMAERRILRSSYGGARPHRDFPLLAKAYLSGRLDLDAYVTARIALDAVNEGLSALRSGDAIRTVIEFPQ